MKASSEDQCYYVIIVFCTIFISFSVSFHSEFEQRGSWLLFLFCFHSVARVLIHITPNPPMPTYLYEAICIMLDIMSLRFSVNLVTNIDKNVRGYNLWRPLHCVCTTFETFFCC